MADHPKTTSARRAVRAGIRARLLAEAERKIQQNSRSLKCGGYDGWHEPQHAGTEGGCRNDGSNCICECHDQETGRG